MHTKFKCTHCGACCKDPAIQLNLTAGDIVRISEHLNIQISKLFEKHFGFHAFSDPDNPGTFDIEPGLNMPCRFYKNNRCSIHPVRPLNCRLFPTWMIIQGIPLDPDSIECVKDLELDNKEIKIYTDYEEIIGSILMEESEILGSILEELDIKDRINIDKDRIEEIFGESINMGLAKQNHYVITNTIKLAEAQIDYKRYDGVGKKIDEILGTYIAYLKDNDKQLKFADSLIL